MATSTSFPELAIKTTIGELNDVEDRFPGTYPILPITTINTLYNVYPHMTDVVTDAPSVLYFGIGINGFYNTGDKIQGTPYQPKANELNLYEPLPFRCVPFDEDLTTAERNKYRMRVEQSFHGERYWCYYLKRLELVDNSAQIVRIDPITGQELPYEFSSEYLTPKPEKPETSGIMQGAITEVVVTKRVRAILSGNEVYEAINVIKEGNLTYAKISEWGLFSGVDHQVQGFDYAGVGFTYTEAIYAQMAYKLCNTGSGVHSRSWDGTRTFTFGNGKLIHQDL